MENKGPERQIEGVKGGDGEPCCKVGGEARRHIEILEAFSTAVTTIVGAVSPAVVSIVTRHGGRNGGRNGEGSGSGVVIAPDGYIVTNSHVVMGAKEIVVEFSDGTLHGASLVGVDPPTDLAAIRVDASGLGFAEVGDSGRLAPGQVVIALGNPFGFDSTVSTGVVSALGRALRSLDGRLIENVIQHTAPLNPGNSGGPLINVRGQIVGINTAIIAMAQGIGFAIPSNTLNWVLAKLMTQGKVSRAYLGIIGGLRPLHRRIVRHYALSSETGVQVVSIEDQGPAKSAGVRHGDVILQIGDKAVGSVDDLHRFLTEWPAGREVKLRLLRGTELKDLSVVPTEAK